MPATKPKLREDVTLVELDQEAVVYDPLSGLVHYLNPMASLVLQLCDGSTTVKETIVELAEAQEVEPDVLEKPIRSLVADFRKVGIVTPSQVASALFEASEDADDKRAKVRREVPRSE